jgi:hypothetical protein
MKGRTFCVLCENSYFFCIYLQRQTTDTLIDIKFILCTAENLRIDEGLWIGFFRSD